MKLFLIDTLSPFFVSLPAGEEYNWSKVPFSLLERGEGLDREKEQIILEAFPLYLKKVKGLGYNAVTIDELCRMIQFDFYSKDLKIKLDSYKSFYHQIITMATNEGLGVFVTSDIMFYNQEIEDYIGKHRKKATVIELLKKAVEKLLREYPRVEGVIFRLGESDGMDVEGDFLSRLFIKKPEQCRKMIRGLIPIFEDLEKIMIIRTWTLGAYAMGDLMWNRDTMEKVFRNLNSECLVVSHKYGESDFFRYLNLNPHFFNEGPQKIIELQAKREYEGFGEFPCYIGKEYEKVKSYLQSANNMLGIMVWTQTGGVVTF